MRSTRRKQTFRHCIWYIKTSTHIGPLFNVNCYLKMPKPNMVDSSMNQHILKIQNDFKIWSEVVSSYGNQRDPGLLAGVTTARQGLVQNHHCCFFFKAGFFIRSSRVPIALKEWAMGEWSYTSCVSLTSRILSTSYGSSICSSSGWSSSTIPSWQTRSLKVKQG